MPTKLKPSIDHRPRFGYVDDIDGNPQRVYEKKKNMPSPKSSAMVVVIPLPFGSANLRRKVKEFVNGTLWPK